MKSVRFTIVENRLAFAYLRSCEGYGYNDSGNAARAFISTAFLSDLAFSRIEINN